MSKNITHHISQIEANGKKLEQSIRILVKDNLTSWQSLASQLLTWHPSPSFIHLIETKKLLPITPNPFYPYFFVNLENGELVYKRNYHDKHFTIISQTSALLFTHAPQRLNTNLLFDEFQKVEALGDKWKVFRTNKEIVNKSNLTRDIADELIRWLITTQVIAYGELLSQYEYITDAVTKLEIKPNHDGVEPTAYNVWLLIDRDLLFLDSQRRIVLK